MSLAEIKVSDAGSELDYHSCCWIVASGASNRAHEPPSSSVIAVTDRSGSPTLAQSGLVD